MIDIKSDYINVGLTIWMLMTKANPNRVSDLILWAQLKFWLIQLSWWKSDTVINEKKMNFWASRQKCNYYFYYIIVII